MRTILGIKKDMTQTFGENGTVYPVTLIDTSKCVVCGFKKNDKDGYDSVILGLLDKKNPKKPEIGKFKNLKVLKVPKYIKEVGKIDDVQYGDKILSSIFNVGEKVEVYGTTKGKGFAGVVKRWGFHGGPKTHGQSDKERHPGSIGSGTTPGNVKKGKKMGGRMGQEKVTVKGLEIIDIKDDIIVLKGAVPGAKNNLIVIKAE
ncbi:MAG: 50S ribosomal protein L3 [Patescibacteria group bacterium]